MKQEMETYGVEVLEGEGRLLEVQGQKQELLMAERIFQEF